MTANVDELHEDAFFFMMALTSQNCNFLILNQCKCIPNPNFVTLRNFSISEHLIKRKKLNKLDKIIKACSILYSTRKNKHDHLNGNKCSASQINMPTAVTNRLVAYNLREFFDNTSCIRNFKLHNFLAVYQSDF